MVKFMEQVFRGYHEDKVKSYVTELLSSSTPKSDKDFMKHLIMYTQINSYTSDTPATFKEFLNDGDFRWDKVKSGNLNGHDEALLMNNMANINDDRMYPNFTRNMIGVKNFFYNCSGEDFLSLAYTIIPKLNEANGDNDPNLLILLLRSFHGGVTDYPNVSEMLEVLLQFNKKYDNFRVMLENLPTVKNTNSFSRIDDFLGLDFLQKRIGFTNNNKKENLYLPINHLIKMAEFSVTYSTPFKSLLQDYYNFYSSCEVKGYRLHFDQINQSGVMDEFIVSYEKYLKSHETMPFDWFINLSRDELTHGLERYNNVKFK